MSLEKIKKQVEFYFSDSNFSKDAFMKQQSLLNNGYIPIDTILTFKKMRELNADKDMIINSVVNSNIVECKDDCLKKIETDEFKNYICDNDIDSRCLYISGFNKNSSLEDIENILADLKPKLIRMRREKNKKFNGSVFVELESVEAIEEALKMQLIDKNIEIDEESTKRHKGGDFLIIMKKKDFLLQKEKMSEENKLSEAKNALKSDYAGKLFRFEVNKEIDIAKIKSIVKDSAFVDLKESVVRLKFAKDFEKKEYNEEDLIIKIRKLTKEEVEDYCDKIPVRPKKVNKKKTNKK